LAHNLDAWLLVGFGRLDEAIATQKKALGLDPLNPLQTADYGWWLYFARRYDEAIAQVRSTLELDPNNAFAHSLWGWCLMGKGNTAAAIAEFEKAKTLDDLPWYDGNLGYAYAISGDRAKAEQVLTHLDDVAKQRYVLPQARVYVYLGLGEKSEALDWLEKYYDAQDFACWLLKVDPVYDSVRHEPRFRALLKKLGLDR
jgi:Flp pilus assembly protein TadD